VNGYAETFGEMEEFIQSQSDEQWHSNVYWSWFHALRALLQEPEPEVPPFMLTDAYRDRQLTAALASWAQLRHATILYAKQSYTPVFPPDAPPPPPPGFVEPVPQFYIRLIELNEQTRAGLEEMGLLPAEVEERLVKLTQLLEQMLDMVVRELAGEQLGCEDFVVIDSLSDKLDEIVAGVGEDGVKTTQVADVHTDQNTGQVLEEGIGYVQIVVVALPLPDGRAYLAAGPVLSYYEFLHPMEDRLTDEAWREMLAGPVDGIPASPPWTWTWTAP